MCIVWFHFAGVHGSYNIFFSVQAHFCCLATCVFVCADVSVGVRRGCLGAFVCVQNTTSGPESEHSQRRTPGGCTTTRPALSDPRTSSPPNPPPLLRVLIFHLNNMVFILPFSYKLLGLVCMIFPKPLGDNTAVPFRRAGDVLYPHPFSSLAQTHMICV